MEFKNKRNVFPFYHINIAKRFSIFYNYNIVI